MADPVSKHNGPMEGERIIDHIDMDDPEFQRQLWRPPDIEQDMKEMDRRKRVDMIMNSQLFREELERIIETQLNEGYTPASLSALQQVTELLLPHTARNSSLSRSGRCVIPINDIRGVDGLRYAKGEKLLRCKLGAVFRLVDMYGWSQDIYNHITVRVSQDQEHFLLNPFGLQYHEITASSLLKVDMQGNIVDPGSTNFSFNRSAFILHSTIHAARPDIKCIVHIQSPQCVAVSAMKCGILPISQEAALLGDISYHEYEGFLIDSHEREHVIRSLGPVSKVLVLMNHGILVCGESVEEAFYLLQRLVLACDTQIKLANVGLDNLHIMSDEARLRIREMAKVGGGSYGKLPSEPPGDEDKEKAEPKERPRKWRVWDLGFESQMRMLDNAGFRTGYLYRQPLIRSEGPRQRNDVECPPSASSYQQYLEEDKWLSPLKKLMEGKRTQDKMKWVNSPNVYQKVEVLETGTTDPKKITKWVEVAGNGDSDSWVQEGSPSHSTLVKIDSPHQFVPLGSDPGEFKRRQKELKANRMNSKVTAGPQSNILEGATWEEIKSMQDAKISQGDQVVLVGAASKGIIQREFQHNAMVYKSAYAKNPFDNVSDMDLEEYKKIVEKKQRGEPVDEDIPDSVKHLLMEPVLSTHDNQQQYIKSPTKSPALSPTSPLSEDEELPQVSKVMTKRYEQAQSPEPIVIKDEEKPGGSFQRSLSARLAAQDQSESQKVVAEEERQRAFHRRINSERKPKGTRLTVNGEDKLKNMESGGDISGTSRSSKEGSPVKDISEESPKKDKKKKKGLRTPSFLKKKKKKEKEEREREKEKGAAEA